MCITCIIRTRIYIMGRRSTHVTPKRGIIRSRIECTRITERISRDTSRLIKFKWIPINPFKQMTCLATLLPIKSQFSKRVWASLFAPLSTTLKISHLPTQYPHWARKAYKRSKYLQNNSCLNLWRWKFVIFCWNFNFSIF